jgi:hypothetical protein
MRTAHKQVAKDFPVVCVGGSAGGLDADVALEFCNFCADLETRGFRRAIEMAYVEKALGASGQVAMTGYVFSESFAAAHRDVLSRYFAAVAAVHEILAHDRSAWEPIKARLNLKDDAALEVYRTRYLDGIPKRTVAEEAADGASFIERWLTWAVRSSSARPRISTSVCSTIQRQGNEA